MAEVTNRFALCNQMAEQAKASKREAARETAHIWLDPMSYLCAEDMDYNKNGSIHIAYVLHIIRTLHFSERNLETENKAILNLASDALWDKANVIYLDTVMPERVVAEHIPRIERALHPRNCCLCGLKTSSGIRALCDDHHQKFMIDADYRHTPLTYDDVASAIWRSDTRHNAIVANKLRVRAA